MGAGQRFCSACGHEAHAAPADAPASRAAQPTAVETAPPQGADIWADVRQRAQNQLLPLGGVLVFGFLDFQLHDQVLGMLIVLLAGAGIVLFAREIVSWATRRVLENTNLNESALAWVQPLFFSVPAALYFLIRGAGTIGSPLLIGLAIAALPPALSYFSPRFDETLRSFYETRDRLIPAAAKPFVLIAISVVVSFGLIHGNVSDVDILWGSTATNRAPPDTTKVLLIAVFNVLLAFAMLRTPADSPERRT